MENGNGLDSCNKVEVNLEKKAETIVIMALEEEKPSLDNGVSDDKLKMCSVDSDKDPSANQNVELPEAVTVVENVESKGSPIEKTTNEENEVKKNGDVAESTDNILTIKVEPKPIETVEEKPLSPPPEKMSAEASVEKTKEAPMEEAKQEILEEEMPDEDDKKNLTDLDMEDQQSSTSSSPSALHIHLDEEDKDESLNDKDKETVDPSLPLISNVVSLSSIASSSSSLTPPPPTQSHQSPSTQPPSPTPSAESGNSSVRRTTLRFKRGIEISFDVDQNGQPVSINNHEAATMPSASSGEPRQKRGRIDDEDDEDASQPDISELDVEGTNNVLSSVQKDIRTLRFMAKQKEKEWNYILKLMKVKEELQAKLMRRREVLKITSSGSRKNQPNSSQMHTVAQTHIQPQQQSGAANLQTLINHSLNAMMGKAPSSSKSIMSNSPVMNHQQSQTLIQQQQLHQQQIQQHQLHQHQLQQQAKLNRQRPILPKPSMQIHPEVQMWSQQNQQQNQHHHHHHHHSHSNSSNQHHHHHNTVVDSVVGSCADAQADARNRQGTISVQSLIADYRAKHPEEIPTRGRRIRQPSRICNDPNSSSSPPPNSQSGGQEGANMSFKDVLLQFAKMSSRQGHANPVDMIQVGKESPGTSGNSTMAGSSGSSSAAALQSLAAARNARSSPHTAGLSAGSILQSALSGSRTNPNFAPTLAQLLTNPANEQHLQHPQQSPLGGNQPTVSIPIATASSSSSSAAVAAAAAAASVASSAEVLTLSNLLATARGHVTITSERSDLANDDVTVVGGSTSGGRSVSSNNGNYLRTSGGSEVPKCQGCNDRVAQFVCAGCSSQWYCSRECQVAAWEEHSEHCVG